MFCVGLLYFLLLYFIWLLCLWDSDTATKPANCQTINNTKPVRNAFFQNVSTVSSIKSQAALVGLAIEMTHPPALPSSPILRLPSSSHQQCANLSPFPPTTHSTSQAGGSDLVVQALDASLDEDISVQLGSDGDDILTAIAAPATDADTTDIVIVGSTSSEVDHLFPDIQVNASEYPFGPSR